METRSKNNCRVIVGSNPGLHYRGIFKYLSQEIHDCFMIWFYQLSQYNQIILLYSPQTQHHFFSRKVPPSLMIALALQQSLAFSAKLVPIRNHPTAFTPFIHDCFSFALVTHVLHHILIMEMQYFRLTLMFVLPCLQAGILSIPNWGRRQQPLGRDLGSTTWLYIPIYARQTNQSKNREEIRLVGWEQQLGKAHAQTGII